MYTGKETVSEGRNAIVVAPDVPGSSLSASGISRFSVCLIWRDNVCVSTEWEGEAGFPAAFSMLLAGIHKKVHFEMQMSFGKFLLKKLFTADAPVIGLL